MKEIQVPAEEFLVNHWNITGSSRYSVFTTMYGYDFSAPVCSALSGAVKKDDQRYLYAVPRGAKDTVEEEPRGPGGHS